MKAHLKYLRYVLVHKWHVLQECWRLNIKWRGIVHDLSKFSPAEWGPYVDRFYGGDWPSYRDVPQSGNIMSVTNGRRNGYRNDLIRLGCTTSTITRIIGSIGY